MTQQDYGADYFQGHCGMPYTRAEPHWARFFGAVAEQIDVKLAPRTVFDAGCAIGFLVEALRSRGVEAYGRDFSEFAITQVPVGLAPYCDCGSIADPISGTYDLVTCIEVLEHMTEDDGRRAIANLCSISPQVFFSSSPTDFEEQTHINVQPPLYWMEMFAEHGFAPRADFDGTFLCPWAILFEKRSDTPSQTELAAQAQLVLLRMQMAERLAKAGSDIKAIDDDRKRILAEAQTRDRILENDIDAIRQQLGHLEERIALAEPVLHRIKHSWIYRKLMRRKK